MEQIKRLIETRKLDGSGDGVHRLGDERGDPKAEPIVDTIGDVKVRIQSKRSRRH